MWIEKLLNYIEFFQKKCSQKYKVPYIRYALFLIFY